MSTIHIGSYRVAHSDTGYLMSAELKERLSVI